jgi:predicted transcriptional regulator of viral defense system
MALRVTTLERTLVDVLDRPALAGGWEEVWRSLEGVDVYLDIERTVRYALLLNNATSAAKLGYFLAQNQERLQVPDDALNPLRAHMPKRPHYVERGQRSEARLLRDWNLMVPTALFDDDRDAETEEIPV